MREFKDLKIVVAGTGYVGLSITTLLAQHHKVTAVDTRCCYRFAKKFSNIHEVLFS